MRRSTLTGLLVVLLFTTGCACSCQPLRQWGPEPAPSSGPVVAFDESIMAKLKVLPPMPQVEKQSVSGPANLDKALAVIYSAWSAHMGRLHDGRLGIHPVNIKGVELKGNTYTDICWLGENARFPQPKYPLNCVDPKSGGVRSALAVWPPGYGQKVQAFAAQTSQRDAWVLASLVAGLSVADHLRAEMRGVPFTWPDGRPFDYCVVGMGLRAVFPATIDQLKDANLPAILAGLDQLVSPPDDPDARLRKLATGFATGSLLSCLG
jgi:hypothetical protein